MGSEATVGRMVSAFRGHWSASAFSSTSEMEPAFCARSMQVLGFCNHILYSQQSFEGAVTVAKKLLRTSERADNLTRSTKPIAGASQLQNWNSTIPKPTPTHYVTKQGNKTNRLTWHVLSHASGCHIVATFSLCSASHSFLSDSLLLICG